MQRIPFYLVELEIWPYFVEEMLDRFLGSKDWKNSPYDLIVSNLNSWGFDHIPIMLEMQDTKKSLCALKEMVGQEFIMRIYRAITKSVDA